MSGKQSEIDYKNILRKEANAAAKEPIEDCIGPLLAKYLFSVPSDPSKTHCPHLEKFIDTFQTAVVEALSSPRPKP